jgi:predicted nucleic acid-binding protein
MSLFVMDASVAAKWFLPPSGEPLSAEARNLLSTYADGRVRFAVPDLFWAECANILWKAVRQGRWTVRSAQASITLLKRRPFPTTSA